jgi:cytochrome c-type biogenesis protein CcmH
MPALVAVFIVGLATGVMAAPEDVANDISQQIMSPYCEGVTLHDCPSDAAVALRERIADWAASGWSRARIMDHLEAQWGDVIRATPPSEGFGVLAWLLPGLALFVGLLALVAVVRRWSLREAAPTQALAPSDRQQLETELSKLRSEP